MRFGHAPVKGRIRVAGFAQTQGCFVLAEDPRGVPFLNAVLTLATVLLHAYQEPVTGQDFSVDAIFIIGVIALYAVTHWIVRALSRLGGVE